MFGNCFVIQYECFICFLSGIYMSDDVILGCFVLFVSLLSFCCCQLCLCLTVAWVGMWLLLWRFLVILVCFTINDLFILKTIYSKVSAG